MSSRDLILSKIRRALGDTGSAARAQTAREHTDRHQRHPVPARTRDKQPAELESLLKGFLEAQQATVIETTTVEQVPAVIAAYLRKHNLPSRLRIGADPILAGASWSEEPNIQLQHGRAQTDDEVGLSRAIGAVAETGTLVLASGPDNPVSVTYVPQTHIVVVSRRDIVGPYEEIWERQRTARGAHGMPRTVNLVSGPSRTADIASKLVTGAHGPQRLCVILVD